MAVWTNETLEMSIRATRNGWTLRAFVTSLNIPSAPYKKGFLEFKTADPKLGRNSVFTPEHVKHVTLLAKTFHGVNPL